MKKQKNTIRSSTAEYLTYVAAEGDAPNSIEIRYKDENVWFTKKMMAQLYNVAIHNINQHIKTIFSEGELLPESTIIYSTALDYDPSAPATKRFFASVQNKMHFCIHGQTEAEVIFNRADSSKENMGLTSWDGSPKSKIHKYDVSIANNYLTSEELQQLQRIVSTYLDMAEMQALRQIPMTMEDWEQRLNKFLLRK